MTDISMWAQPEITMKDVYAGLYPMTIIAARAFKKEMELEDGTKFMEDMAELTLRTTTEVPLPDGTNEKIVVKQAYQISRDWLVNALNGIGRAVGINILKSIQEFEGKTVMFGVKSWARDTDNGVEYRAQPHFAFTYAPITESSKVEFIANDFPDGETSKEDMDKWFKDKVNSYKSPK